MHQDTKWPVCPYCGNTDEEGMFDITGLYSDDDVIEQNCPKCSNQFKVKSKLVRLYSTDKIVVERPTKRYNIFINTPYESVTEIEEFEVDSDATLEEIDQVAKNIFYSYFSYSIQEITEIDEPDEDDIEDYPMDPPDEDDYEDYPLDPEDPIEEDDPEEPVDEEDPVEDDPEDPVDPEEDDPEEPVDPEDGDEDPIEEDPEEPVDGDEDPVEDDPEEPVDDDNI